MGNFVSGVQLNNQDRKKLVYLTVFSFSTNHSLITASEVIISFESMHTRSVYACFIHPNISDQSKEISAKTEAREYPKLGSRCGFYYPTAWTG
jgi:hypothetical protein